MTYEIIEQHYKENYKKLHRRMTYRSGSERDGEEIVQEAYARALKYANSYNGDGFDKWFNIVLHNTFMAHLRDMDGMGHSQFDEEVTEGTDCTHYNDQVLKEINELIQTKAIKHIEILTLHINQEYSPIDITNITENSYIYVYKVITRFRQELRELYG